MAKQRTRTSELKDWGRCQQRWQWAWVEQYAAQGPPPVHFWFGIGWHLVMAHIYQGPGRKRGRKPLKVWREYCDAELTQYIKVFPDSMVDEPKYIEAGELGESMLGRYLDTYHMDPQWWIIEPECTFAFPLRKGRVYNGTFDLVLRDESDNDELRLEEHKTARAIFLHHLSLDPQAGGYWAVADLTLRAQGKIGKRERLKGIEYNFARKALPDARPANADGLYLNKDGSISKVQPPAHFVRHTALRTPKERAMILRRTNNTMDQMDDIRNGSRQPGKNATKDCAYDCTFFGMCELHEAGADWREFGDMVFRRKDPYADHRKSAGE